MGSRFFKNDPKPRPYSQRNLTGKIQCHSLNRPVHILSSHRLAQFYDLVYDLEKFLGGTPWTEGKGVAAIIHALRRLRACHPLTQIE